MTERPAFNPDDQPGRILAAILDASDDAVITTDPDGTILTWNRAASQVFGYAADELVGRSIAILVPLERAGELERALSRIRAGVPFDHLQTVQRTKDGRVIDVSINLRPVKDATGRLVAATAIVRDVSEQKRVERALQASEAHWRSIIESAVDAIIVIDARGRIEVVNPAAERMFGYAEADLLGGNVNRLMPAPYHEEHDGYLRHYLETGERRIIGIGREATGLRKDGSVFPMHLSVGEMVVEGQRKFTGILHDLTERVRMEARLREQSALSTLGEMAAVVAHEVKNPLTGIRGAIQIIGGRLAEGSKDAAITKEIVARIDALNELISDILLFARPPKPKFMPVDIVSLLRLVADLVHQDPALRGVDITVAGAMAPMAADADMLKIVVHNLLLNSAHAMQGRGVVEISAVVEGARCRITVADAGPGIAADVRAKLFTPFFTTKARGTGLGLSTARRLIEAHRGSLTIECPAQGGTVVTLDLPAEAL